MWRAEVLPGKPFPLGATYDGSGVNFAVFSEHAKRIEVCLFDSDDPSRETRRFSLLETTRLCEEITRRTVPIHAVPETRPADMRWYVSDISRVAEATGWRPRHAPRDILTAIDAWLLDEAPTIRHLWVG